MIKVILAIFLSCSFGCFGQTNITKLTSKISLYFNTYSLGEKKYIYLNNKELILDINDYQIPLNDVVVKYESDPRIVNGLKREGLLVFECERDCIINKDKSVLSIGYAFKNKKAAYDIIEFISQLTKELNE